MTALFLTSDACETLKANGINPVSCAWMMEDKEAEEWRSRIEGILSDGYKFQKMEVTSIYDLAAFLDEYAEAHPDCGWPEEARDIIRANGWEDLSEVEGSDAEEIAYDRANGLVCYYGEDGRVKVVSRKAWGD